MYLGLVWALISKVPYLIMVAGYVELPLVIKILTFPAWIGIKISDIYYSLTVNFLITLDPMWGEVSRYLIEIPVRLLFPLIIGEIIGILVVGLFFRKNS